ncbi:MAG: ubiquinone/menaquinone biosynthesis C-methylase UbiE [Planctomycetota bacterium]
MARDPLGERWPEVYRDSPHIFDRFSRAEDRFDVVAPRLIELARLAGCSVLEMGCGTGRWTRSLASTPRSYAALEPQAGMLQLAQAAGADGVSWILGRGEALPVASCSLDRVLATWVFANMRPKVRARSIAEAHRVVKPGGEIWLLENHWEDDFQELRRDAGLPVEVEVQPLTEEFGFELVEVLETEMAFESEADAREVLGQILGPRVDEELARSPRVNLVHRVCLLKMP